MTRESRPSWVKEYTRQLNTFIIKKSGINLSIDKIVEHHHALWENKWHGNIAIVNRNILPVDSGKNIPLWKKYAAFYFRTGEKCLTKFYSLNQPF